MAETNRIHDTRRWIRALPTLTGTPPPAPATFPATPAELFLDWLARAVDDAVVEPHVCALSTVDDAGLPDSRYLILKDVDTAGFWFSGSARSPKGVELQASPRAALAFYWRETGQQVRVRGTVSEGDESVRSRDFLERSVTARAVATASEQSRILTDPSEYDAAVSSAIEMFEGDPDHMSSDWRAWCLEPESVEFWQADSGRRHQRWLYRRDPEGLWTTSVLWP
ncbi:pyridoxamine 5'-phosphate oxidase [Rhodococcus sp. 27YEA15]|uniref:pyridoxine/pyridoxamine 5'-phosphate oxidase n=1 Tax=Rhodococcus sp. 27YEA15 TaxID=3156259 RepID=UPI003C7B823B